MLDDFQEIVMPMMISYLKNTTVIIMAAEGTTRTDLTNRNFTKTDNRVHEAQNYFDMTASYYNDRMADIVFRKYAGKTDNIYFMYSNKITHKGPNGEQVCPDHTHKIVKQGLQSIPDALYADVAGILNVHCNQRDYNLGSDYCCKG